MTPAQQADALNLYKRLYPQRALPEVVSVDAVQVFTPPSRPQQVPAVWAGPLPQWQIIRRGAQLRALCAANGGHIALAPGGCVGGAPITLLDTAGGASGKNSWIVTPLTVTLTARDVSGAGIDHTEYGFDGANYVPYTGPFIAPEGEITIYYRSLDLAGSIEPANLRSFKIDTRPPTAQAASIMNATNVTMTYAVSDPIPGSGPAGLHTISHGPGGLETRYTPAAAGTITFDTLCTDIEYWGEDVAGKEQSPHLHTADLVPPVLTAQPDSFCMWPPNHRRVRFRLGSDVSVTATDTCDAAPAVTVVAVTSSEPDNGFGDGDTSGDVSFSRSAFCVRRERSGTGTGRAYTVTIEAKDYSGNTTQKQVHVVVPLAAQSGCGLIGTEIDDGAPCE